MYNYTGQQPTDPSIGFLPPNPENGTDGQGYVTYTVRANRHAQDFAVIDAEARIIFDQNDPIDTPPIFNTVRRLKLVVIIMEIMKTIKAQ